MEQLARSCPGLLLLTATPTQLGREGHFARLRLLDPDRYADYDKFLKEAEGFGAVAEIAEKIIEQREGSFDPSLFVDRYEQALTALIADKAFDSNAIIADLDARSIHVTATRGTIQLRGVVHSFAEHRSARFAAEAAPGVTKVENEILVTP